MRPGQEAEHDSDDDDRERYDLQEALVIADAGGSDGAFDGSHLGGRRRRFEIICVLGVRTANLVRIQPEVPRIGAQGSPDVCLAEHLIEGLFLKSPDLIRREHGVTTDFLDGDGPPLTGFAQSGAHTDERIGRTGHEWDKDNPTLAGR